MRRTMTGSVLVALSLLMTGCVSGDPGSSGSGSSPAVSSVGSSLVVTLHEPSRDVTMTLHPIEVVDDHAVLVVDVLPGTPRNLDPDHPIYGFGTEGLLGAGPDNHRVYGFMLVDLPGGRVWSQGVDEDGKLAGSRHKMLSRGETYQAVSVFSAPDTETVDVFVPRAGLVRDVPVVQGGSDTPSLASLELSGEVRFPGPVPIDTYTQSYDEGVAARSSGDAQELVLAADVLFDSDQAVLNPAAVSLVDQVAGSIKEAAGSGQVRVVGHTDDVDTEEYNLDLSRRRAEAVAERLRGTLGSGFTVVTEGKGKSEPAVAGTDPQARQANRRVEVSFEATSAPVLPTVSVPEPTVPVASGHGWVEYPVDYDGGTFRASVERVVRRDGYLIGTVVTARVTGDGDERTTAGVVGGGFFPKLEYANNDRRYAAWRLHILSAGGRVFASRYQVDGQAWVLADRAISGRSTVGAEVPWTVIWPDTGTDMISIEAPERFRITDIPVEDA